MRKIFQKSIVSIVDIPENTVITENMIGFKKPGNGLSPILYKEIIGGKATRLIPKNKAFDMVDLIQLAKKKKKQIGVYPIDDESWIDVGQWSEYRKAVDRLI